MSDENLNNNTAGSEETAALFVSAQKRKQAQAEAAKRAAEEQAQREAAEAEVRRMEAEVEERRRKAEEEQKALEEARQNMDTHKDVTTASVIMEGALSKLPESVRKRLPLYLGIAGAVLVALIVVIVIIATGGKKINYESLQCTGEYMSEEEGYGVKLYYPDSVYTEITEEDNENWRVIQFRSDNKKAPDMDVQIIPLGKSVQQLQFASDEAVLSFQTLEDALEDEGDVEVEQSVDLTDLGSNESGKYITKFTANDEETKKAQAVASWFETTESGEVAMVSMNCSEEKAKTVDNVVAMRDLVSGKNDSDAVSLPGKNAPTTFDWDGSIEIKDLKMNMPVPKDSYQMVKTSQEYGDVYCDQNGAIIIVGGFTIMPGGEEGYQLSEDDFDSYMEYFEGMASMGLKDAFPIEDRTFVSETQSPFTTWEYMAELSGKYHGIDYWERDTLFLCDVDGDLCLGAIITYVPAENKDVYKDIFDRSIKSIEDI